MDINTIQDIAHTYLQALPLDQRVQIMHDVLELNIQVTSADEYSRDGVLWDASKMDEFTMTYIHWMRVDESQKIFDFIQH